MRIVDGYVLKNILIATVFVTLVLSVLILLTQSLRFLELVIGSGASGLSFWALTLLTLPKFLEVILPLSLMAAVLFVYNRLTMDSELIVLRALGFSPLRLARPALLLGAGMGVLLFFVMGWLAPMTNSSLIALRLQIKAEMSTLLFREGVFNQAGKNLMVYLRERGDRGELKGLIIHDSRDPDKPPSTIIAERGILVTDNEKNQVLVYNGSRQDFDTGKRTLRRLDFDQYTIDLPEPNPVRVRWQEPEERTFMHLFEPDLKDSADRRNRRAFHIEITKRILTPFLVPSYALIALCALLLGSVERRGQSKRILVAISGVLVIHAFYLGAYNLARQSDIGLLLMYLITFVPLGAGAYLMLCDSRGPKRKQAEQDIAA